MKFTASDRTSHEENESKKTSCPVHFLLYNDYQSPAMALIEYLSTMCLFLLLFINQSRSLLVLKLIINILTLDKLRTGQRNTKFQIWLEKLITELRWGTTRSKFIYAKKPLDIIIFTFVGKNIFLLKKKNHAGR